MRKTRKLCAIMIDTIGRELIINREVQIDDKGWPKHEGQSLKVAKGDRVRTCFVAQVLAPDMDSRSFCPAL